MAFFHQFRQVWLTTIVGVYLRDVLLPVAMVAVGGLQRNGWNPDGVSAQCLDIVKFAEDTLKSTATVCAQVWTGAALIAVQSEAVGQ